MTPSCSESNTPTPTIIIDLIEEKDCPHCAALTIQVKGGKKTDSDDGYACLQCIADSSDPGCCTLKPLDRWSH